MREIKFEKYFNKIKAIFLCTLSIIFINIFISTPFQSYEAKASIDNNQSSLVIEELKRVKNQNQIKSFQDTPRFAPSQPINCETLLAALDDGLIEAKGADDSYLIVVAKHGNEESANISKMRMSFIEKYLSNRTGGNFKYIVTESKSVKGFGRIELYVKGKLEYVLLLKRNENFKNFCG